MQPGMLICVCCPLPVVESVSPVSGSNAGGTLITIGGKYFDETNAKVTVGGTRNLYLIFSLITKIGVLN